MRCLATALVGAVALAGCSSNELTREHAAGLIQEHAEFASVDTYAQIDDDNLNLGLNMGLWQRTRGFGPPGIELGPAGGEYFKRAGVQMLAPVAWPLEPIRRRLLEVTGLVDVGAPIQGKEVQFTWDYDALPPWLVKLERDPNIQRTGTAFFRLYDDGWRVEEVSAEPVAMFGVNLPALFQKVESVHAPDGGASVLPVGKWSTAESGPIGHVCFSADGRGIFGQTPAEAAGAPWCTWSADGSGSCGQRNDGSPGLPFNWSMQGDSLMVNVPSEGISATYQRDDSLRCFFE